MTSKGVRGKGVVFKSFIKCDTTFRILNANIKRTDITFRNVLICKGCKNLSFPRTVIRVPWSLKHEKRRSFLISQIKTKQNCSLWTWIE